MSHWKHDKLCEDLAISLGGTPYLNVPLGSRFMRAYENQIKLYRAIAQAEDYQTARKNLHQVQMADVMRVLPSYTRFCVFIYEVKVSRNDFYLIFEAESGEAISTIVTASCLPCRPRSPQKTTFRQKRD